MQNPNRLVSLADPGYLHLKGGLGNTILSPTTVQLFMERSTRKSRAAAS